jgi:hypothetical protein
MSVSFAAINFIGKMAVKESEELFFSLKKPVFIGFSYEIFVAEGLFCHFPNEKNGFFRLYLLIKEEFFLKPG